MFRRFLPSFAVLALALVPVLSITLPVPDAAHAQASPSDADRERARTEFQRGVAAVEAQDFRTALAAFQEAYRLAPHPSVRLNMANCYEHLNQPIEALFHYEHFLTEAQRPASAQRREVEASIRRLRASVGEIVLHVSPDGATVTIDSTERRRAPIAEPIRVGVGPHVIDVEAEGFAPGHQVVEIAGGQTARVEIRLNRPEVATATPAPAEGGATATEGTPAEGGAASEGPVAEGPGQTPPPGGGDDGDGGEFRITTPVWIAGGITAAAGIGAAIFGGLALSANSDFERHRDAALNAGSVAARNASTNAAIGAANDADTFAAVTDALLVTTIVGAGATVFFLFTTQEGGMLDDTASIPGPTLVAVPVVTDDFAGASIAGSF